MRKIPEIKLQLTLNILDIQKSTFSNGAYTIPLKRTKDNNKYYDDAYVLLGRKLDFTLDGAYSSLSLCVELNTINQYRFFLLANYKELNIRDSTDELLERQHIKQEISLSDEEIQNIRYVLKEICVA